MKADLVIGVDCSTTSCKAIIWDPNGKRVAEGRSELDILTPKPLWHEQSANAWWEATVNAIQYALRQTNLDRLAALCITTQRETFVPVDEFGTPLRNAILWMDERAEEQLGYLDKVIGEERFHKVTGKPLSGNLSVTKILWLQKHEPEVFQKTYKFLDVHAFLVHRLTNQFCTGWGCADPMGLYDMVQDQWAFDLLHSINLSSDQFPDTSPSGQVIGEITQKASEECGLPVRLPVVTGIGDGQSAGLGSRVIDFKTAYLSLGTSIISGYYSPTYQISEKFRTMYGGVENTFFLETVILGGTYTISWLLKNVLHKQSQDLNKSIEDLENSAWQLPSGAQGLLLVPYFNSVMNPYWDTKASGMIIGLRGIHGDGHIYRAILEGIAYEQRLHTSGVEDVLDNKTENYVVVGGGAKSKLWCQIIADVTGKPVHRALEREASALGAGILAASALDIYPDIREAAQAMVHLDADIFEPNQKRHHYYSRIFEDVYKQIYPALRGKLRILADC